MKEIWTLQNLIDYTTDSINQLTQDLDYHTKQGDNISGLIKDKYMLERLFEIAQTELDRQENKALTIEELSQIDDTQVWFVCEDEELCYKVIIDDVNEFRTSFTPHYKGTRNVPSNAKQRWSVLNSQIEKGYFNFYKHKPNEVE